MVIQNRKRLIIAVICVLAAIVSGLVLCRGTALAASVEK